MCRPDLSCTLQEGYFAVSSKRIACRVQKRHINHVPVRTGRRRRPWNSCPGTPSRSHSPASRCPFRANDRCRYRSTSPQARRRAAALRGCRRRTESWNACAGWVPDTVRVREAKVVCSRMKGARCSTVMNAGVGGLSLWLSKRVPHKERSSVHTRTMAERLQKSKRGKRAANENQRKKGRYKSENCVHESVPFCALLVHLFAGGL